jgi:uncharacterized repeat protein (TIGR01451 family)
MKTVVRNAGRLARLGVTAFALLLSQQVLALGTDAGTVVSNQATVAYSVSGNPQDAIESDPLGNAAPGSGSPTVFLVDRRVSFTLIEVDGAHTTPVGPGSTDVFTAFTLTNTGNASMDFRLSVADFAGAVFGIADSTDLGNYRIRVANGDGAGGVPVLGDLDFVDELAEDAVVEIYVFADAPLTVLNGQYANIELTATAADDAIVTATPGTLDPDLAESPGVDDPTIIESVFADAGNDGFEVAQDGYEILSAALVITKTAAVISDPFGSGKAVPGAIVEYTITVDNSLGLAPATSVSISDTIDADVTFVLAAYGGAGQDISLDNGGAASTCSADPAAGDTDGCSLDGAALVVGNATVPMTVAAGTVLVVQFQVLIPNL